jgi:hypothetical protein
MDALVALLLAALCFFSVLLVIARESLHFE